MNQLLGPRPPISLDGFLITQGLKYNKLQLSIYVLFENPEPSDDTSPGEGAFSDGLLGYRGSGSGNLPWSSETICGKDLLIEVREMVHKAQVSNLTGSPNALSGPVTLQTVNGTRLAGSPGLYVMVVLAPSQSPSPPVHRPAPNHPD